MMNLNKRTMLITFLFIIVLFTGCKANNNVMNDTKSPNTKSVPSEKKVIKEVKPTAEEILDKKIDDKVSKMSISEKIGQLFVMDFKTDSNGNNLTKMTPEVQSFMETNHIGGVIFFDNNIETEDQTKKLISDFKSTSTDIPVLVGVDEEGGLVSRLRKLYGSYAPPAQIVAQGGVDNVRNVASDIGTKLQNLGFNLDFAPDADVTTNPNNVAIGNRAFSTDKSIVAQMVVTELDALKSHNVIGVVKHFPGHGDTSSDPHTGIAVANYTLNDINSTELVPFKSAIDNGVQMILVGHISTPNITGNNEPATFSNYLLNGILRGQLKYKGVIISDAMDMGAIVDYYSLDYSITKMLNNGVDMLLMPQDNQQAIDIVKSKLQSGEISQQSIDEKVKRILKLKAENLGYLK